MRNKLKLELEKRRDIEADKYGVRIVDNMHSLGTYKTTDFKEGFKIALEVLLPILAKAIEQRDFIYKCYENDDIVHWNGSAREFKDEDNAELLKMLETK